MKSLIPKWLIDFHKSRKRSRQIARQMALFKGDAVICPICNSRFSEFGYYGIPRRENARCHTCGSLERHRLLWKYLTEKLRFFESHEPINLLHFAPERMFYQIFCGTKNLEYLPCDLSPSKYNYKGKVSIVKVDITDIPFNEDTFDFIICSHVLEHVPDDQQAMRELFRVMKSSGSGILQVPIHNRPETYEDFSIQTPQDRERVFGQHDHVRIYGRDYVERLRNAGFKVTEDDFAKRLSPAECFKYGISASEVIYYCQKL